MEKNRAKRNYKDLWIKVNQISNKESKDASPEPLLKENAEVISDTKPDAKPEASDKITTQSQAIDYSVKIIKFLDGKRKKFNKENGRKMTLERFKEVFCLASVDSNIDPSINKNTWSVAHVNNFVKNNCKELCDAPSLEDIKLAKKESKEFGLVMDFNLDELFLQDKPMGYHYYSLI
jgi:hypothetical protein